MKQVLVRGGKVCVEDVPVPGVMSGGALVRVHRSLISSGTESGFVSDGGTASFVMKKARDPLNVEKLKRKIASVGVRGAWEVVRNKLFEFQTPGYSCSGCIVQCGDDLQGFRMGDPVACAGVGYAAHAEYVWVPQNLLTPIPMGVGFDEAAFVALGAIAMQGVRQSAPTFGETFVIMGLGLLGQLALQIMRAAGCRVICSDPVPSKRELAASLGADVVCSPGELSRTVDEWTGGFGADGVVICAASKGSEVTVSALDLCRHKGRVTVVGAVGMQLSREPMYMKELDFRLSCSYGPGRYNPAYEEKGLDYPIGYVRWTEGRNMGEFLRMVAEKKVQVRPLITATHAVESAAEAYAMILDKEREAISVELSYGGLPGECVPGPCPEKALPERKLALRAVKSRTGAVRVAVIGAGGFASAFHLPNLSKMPEAELAAVVDAVPHKAKQAADKYKASYCTAEAQEVLKDPDIQAVVIATRHNMHKPLAMAALQAGKHVFVEKPLAITNEDCEELVAEAEKTGLLLSVGFNRRFSTFVREAKPLVDRIVGPKMMLYRCNAGQLPPGHWATDPVEGGGRIIGEGVHFLDLCCWMLRQDPVEVQAVRLDGAGKSLVPADNMSITLRFPDGSIATILYCCVGNLGLSKELVEIYGGGGGLVIDDYRGIRFAGLPAKDRKQAAEHKGQYELMENFVKAIRGEAELCVTARDGLRATRLAREALRQCNGGEAAVCE